MTPKEFVNYLKETVKDKKSLNAEETRAVVAKLQTVFNKVTPIVGENYLNLPGSTFEDIMTNKRCGNLPISYSGQKIWITC